VRPGVGGCARRVRMGQVWAGVPMLCAGVPGGCGCARVWAGVDARVHGRGCARVRASASLRRHARARAGVCGAGGTQRRDGEGVEWILTIRVYRPPPPWLLRGWTAAASRARAHARRHHTLAATTPSCSRSRSRLTDAAPRARQGCPGPMATQWLRYPGASVLRGCGSHAPRRPAALGAAPGPAPVGWPSR